MNFKIVNNCISELLYTYDCVIVPDLGAFVTNHIPSAVHPTQHIFTPPSKKLTFNRNIRHNDGLLANHLANKENISYDKAVRLISLFVNEIRREIYTDKKFSITNVGLVYLDVEKNLQFEPDYTLNYLVSSYGLTSFQSLPIKREHKKGSVKEVFTINTDQNAIQSGKLSRYLIPTSIAASLLIGVSMNFNYVAQSYLGFAGIFDNKQPIISVYHPAKEIAKSKIIANDSIATYLKSLKIIGEPKISITAQPSIPVVKTAEIPEKQKATTTSAILYHLIAGCFSKQENANKLIADLKSKGYTNVALLDEKRNGLFVVSIQSFNNEKDANLELASLKTSIVEKIWILKK